MNLVYRLELLRSQVGPYGGGSADGPRQRLDGAADEAEGRGQNRALGVDAACQLESHNRGL